MDIKDKIIKNLKEVYDPEIPVNVYDLGLIYEIKIKDKNKVEIIMTLTSPTCPTGDYIKTMIEDAAKNVSEVSDVKVNITFEPPWSPDKLTDEARDDLGIFDTIDSNLGINQMFDSKDSAKKKICFNCSKEENEIPIFSCFFKGEDVFICSKCISKF